LERFQRRTKFEKESTLNRRRRILTACTPRNKKEPDLSKKVQNTAEQTSGIPLLVV